MLRVPKGYSFFYSEFGIFFLIYYKSCSSVLRSHHLVNLKVMYYITLVSIMTGMIIKVVQKVEYIEQ